MLNACIGPLRLHQIAVLDLADVDQRRSAQGIDTSSGNNMRHNPACLCSFDASACMRYIVSTLKLVQEQGAHQIVLIEEAPRMCELKLLPIPSSSTVTDQLTIVLRHCRAGDRCVSDSPKLRRIRRRLAHYLTHVEFCFVSSAYWLKNACAGMESLSYSSMS